MDEQAFVEKYWHINTQIVTVTNPRTEDFVFKQMVQTGIDRETGRPKEEQRTYMVKAGKTERFPGPLANLYLDQMTKLIAQDEEKIHFLIDWALKAQYYDQLIVSIEDLIDSYRPPEADYLNAPTATAQEDVTTVVPDEKPFAEAPKADAKAKA